MNLIIIVQQIFNYFRTEDVKGIPLEIGVGYSSRNFSLPFYFLIATSLIRGGAV